MKDFGGVGGRGARLHISKLAVAKHTYHGEALKLLNEDLLQKYIPYAFLNIFMESWNWNFVGKIGGF